MATRKFQHISTRMRTRTWLAMMKVSRRRKGATAVMHTELAKEKPCRAKKQNKLHVTTSSNLYPLVRNSKVHRQIGN
jgi:hypothetical protein